LSSVGIDGLGQFEIGVTHGWPTAPLYDPHVSNAMTTEQLGGATSTFVEGDAVSSGRPPYGSIQNYSGK
jgi:hypothetical protein